MKTIQSYTSHDQTGILLNANESSIQFDAAVLQEIQEGILEVAWNRYPDTDCKQLKQTYADMQGIGANQIIVGNGSDQMLGIMIGSFLSKGKTLYTLDPDFSMYDYYVSMYDANIEKEAYTTAAQWIQTGKEKQADMILFSNPNNPTGMYLEKAELVQIIEAFPDIPIVIDEAYGEFSKDSALDLISKYSNVYITRTLSKAYALASIRIGFLISSKENIEKIQQKMVPYSVSSIDQKVACIVLKHTELFEKEIERIKQVRKSWLEKSQAFKKMEFLPSQANFILVKSNEIETLNALFDHANIKIRKFKGENYSRITIGNDAENEAVFQIFQQFEEGSYESRK